MGRFLLPLDVMLFELRRSMTLGRLAVWVLLIAFPVAIVATMMTIVRIQIGKGAIINQDELIQTMGFTIYFLVPEVTCLLGLLLWATPAISTEIEGQTWVYIALRSSGRRMVLLGKYLTAVVWTLSAALIAIAVCTRVVGSSSAYQLWWVLSSLAVLSCFVHAALYVLIGALFYRRTMAVALVYTVVVEFGISFVPALVNKFTVNYRLRGLLANWMDWEDVRSAAENIFGSESTSTHLMFLVVTTLALLSVALFKVEHSEYPTHQES